MENIKNWFLLYKRSTGEDYNINEYEDSLEVRTKLVIFMIVKPHSGTDNKWMLQVAPFVSFDRWGNSVVIKEFFSTDIELCDYLGENQLIIYKALLEDLSQDYKILEDEYNEN